MNQTMIDVGQLLGIIGLFVEILRLFNKLENRTLLTQRDVRYIQDDLRIIHQKLDKIEIKVDGKQTRTNKGEL